MEQTSKVTVSYWDPAALYPLIEPDFRSRLPLRNLHWKSPSRPLRSINSLHVDLVPYSPPPTNLTSPTTLERPPGSSSSNGGTDLTRVRSSESARSVEGSAIKRSTSRSKSKKGRNPRKERRHQIPGLRNTPYLKVYFLRCDDNDSYRATSRKLLRDWISTHATSAGGDNHDAFEWLIVHVVLPGTPAAMQPRSSSSSATPSSGPRWMKSGSTTLLDKIKSDFNGSSSKVDRVIQIRIPSSHPALSTLSPPVTITNQTVASETPAESEVAWVDMVAKFKSQILSSFDARVSQYEEDVREKDSQRRLPGWNFCTFFVLKEGLARAFEAVGLVEDALVLYDELEVGLDAIVREQGKEGDVVGGRFIGWTKEGLWWIEEGRRQLAIRKRSKDGNPTESEPLSPADEKTPFRELLNKARKEGKAPEVDEVDDACPVDADKKPYRELILSNEISVFDFRCYLFARQATLLVRLGRRSDDSAAMTAPSGGSSLQEAASAAVKSGDSEDDLSRLAEVCKRGVEFTTSVGRVLRADLWAGYNGYAEESPRAANQKEEITGVIDNLVASWTYAVCQQLVAQTTSSALPKGLDEGTDQGLIPRRTSSLVQREDVATFSQPMKNRGVGMEELAAGRADLVLLSRVVVEDAGKKKGWVGKNGWFYIHDGTDNEMEDVDLNGDPEKSNEVKKPMWIPEGIRTKVLRDVFTGDDQDGFYELFIQLSEKAMRHYSVAKRFKSAERVEADLAALKYHLKDYENAATHLQRMTNFYSDQGWGLIETTLLAMYARCLRDMHKPQEYVKVLLKLLSSSAAAEKARVRKRAGRDTEDDMPVPQTPLGKNETLEVDVRGYVGEALRRSQELEDEVTTPMTQFWSDISVDPFPRYLKDQDGFEVAVRMRYLLEEEMETDRIAVHLVSTSSQGKDIWLDASPGPKMRKGIVRATAHSNITIPGSYIVDKLMITANKLTFLHEVMAKSTPTTPLGLRSHSAIAITTAKKTKLALYSTPRNLLARLEMPKKIHLDQMRGVDIVLETGENDVTVGEARIRSGTAGLRLMTGSLEVVEGTTAVSSKDNSGVIGLKDISRGQSIRLRLPYTAETDITDLAVRLEVDYATEHGKFFYSETLSLQVALPLAVNVQDVFKMDMLFSKFQVSTAAAEIPLRIVRADLQGSRNFDATCGKESVGGMVVFAKQPASFVYKITRKQGDGKSGQEPLALVIEYTSLNEEMREAVVAVFKQGLKDAGLELYEYCLLPVLRFLLRQRRSTEMETAALLDEVEMGTYEDRDWEEALEGINPRTGEREKVEAWLKEFFTKNESISLELSADQLATITRAIVIPVEVPQLQVIHTIDLRLLTDSTTTSTSYTPPMVTVGQALPAELVIKHSRKWDTASSNVDDNNIPISYFYEIQNSNDIWLVSGRKRAHFEAVEGSEHRFPLLLVPVRPGHLLLPNVEIRQVQVDGQPLANAESDYRGNAESVLVLPDVRSTTVRIESMYANNGGAGEVVVSRA